MYRLLLDIKTMRGSSLEAPSEADPSLIGGEDPPLDFGGKGRDTE